MNNKRNVPLIISVIVAFCVGLLLGIGLINHIQKNSTKVNIVGLRLAATQFLSQGKLDEATLAIMNLIVAEPDNYTGYLLLGDIYLKQNSPALAKLTYQKALARLKNGKDSTFFSLSANQKKLQQCVINAKIQGQQLDDILIMNNCVNQLEKQA